MISCKQLDKIKDKEKNKVRCKKWYQENKERVKEWYWENREKIRKYKKEYFRKNLKSFSERLKKWRHKKGISKKYNSEIGISYTKEYKKLHEQKRSALEKSGGLLTIETIQLVYEDNIKRYGTLTCYLCLQSIKFGKDSLEHKIPLVKGGTNEYCNLAIACISCNSKKHDRTEKEYRKIMKKSKEKEVI